MKEVISLCWVNWGVTGILRGTLGILKLSYHKYSVVSVVKLLLRVEFRQIYGGSTEKFI